MTKLSNLLGLIMSKEKGFITTEGIVSQGYPKADVSRILAKLSKDKIIYKVSRGIYSKEPLESADIFHLSERIFQGYIGFASACYIYGWLEYFPFEICIVTKNKSSFRRIGKFLIRAIALKEKATGSRLYEEYVISSKGKTLFDIFYKPELVGGWKEVAKIVHRSDAGKQDWEDFLSFSLRFGSSSFRQRAGYLISQLEKRTGKKIRVDLKAVKPKNMVVARLGYGKPAVFSDNWQVVDCLGEEMFGWYNGD